MKKLIVIISVFIFSISVFNQVSFSETVQSTSNQVNEIIKESDNTFNLVYANGNWWIYEYDQDGKLINIYPADRTIKFNKF